MKRVTREQSQTGNVCPFQKASTILVFARHKFLQHLASSKSRDKSSSFLSLSHTGGLRSPRSIYL